MVIYAYLFDLIDLTFDPTTRFRRLDGGVRKSMEK
jgi:hypothetical protein